MWKLSQEDVDQIIREVRAEPALVEACLAAGAAGLFDEILSVPAEPGLYAVVAADGVTVRVVDERVTRRELYEIMHRDIANRVLFADTKKLIEQGATLTSLLRAQTPQVAALRKQYRLEKLPGSRRSDEMSIIKTSTKIEVELEPVAVGPGRSRTLAFEATEPLKLTRLRVSHEAARSFVLVNLRVAGREMIYPGDVPAAIFSPSAVPVELDYHVDAKSAVEVTFVNVTDAEHDLEVQLTGVTRTSRPSDGSASGLVDRLLDLERDRVMIVGLGRTDVPPKQACNISTQPYARFQANRLIIPSAIVQHFDVTDMKVGKNSQIRTTGAMPAELFSEEVVVPDLRLDPCDPSRFLTLSVLNKSPLPQVFSAAWVGTMDRPPDGRD
jgi:hypothetical protein